MTETAAAGLYAPVITPFRADLAPDTERFVARCRWLLDDGCHGLGLFGTTSEANSLSIEERMALTEAVVEAGIAPARLIVGTGMCAIPDAVRLTAHAVGLGCAGVLMLPPFYYKGMSDEGLAAAFDEVIDRVGDPRLRIYLYHFPQLSGVPVSLGLIERLVKAHEGTVVGIKDSSGDWNNTRAILEAFPGFGTFSGSEEALLATMRGGGAGCISATANVNAAGIRRLYDGWQGPEADTLQERATAVRRAVQSQALVPALKTMTARNLGDDAWRTVRPPMLPLDAEQEKALIEALDTIGFEMSGA
jgi:4-hydroxy-tetrahydrodipicolinate synthase